MKKIVPFTNDIKFNTRIYEITSISLEHNLKIKDNNMITGEFIVSGEYKMTDSSINAEPFIYGLPFDISLDTKYDIDRLKVDIDDFNFEIINDELLRVNIAVLIEGIELVELEEDIEEIKPDVLVESVRKENINEEIKEENIPETINKEEERLIMNTEKLEDLFKQDDEVIIPVMEENQKEVTSIFNNFSDKDEKYVTYYVHIVRENDNIESICTKYNTTRDNLNEYNNIDELTLGSKIIIPYIDETI